MNSGLILIILLIVVCILLAHHFEPRIDVVITGRNSYKVLLWYNKWELSGRESIRSYIELFQVEKKLKNERDNFINRWL